MQSNSLIALQKKKRDNKLSTFLEYLACLMVLLFIFQTTNVYYQHTLQEK